LGVEQIWPVRWGQRRRLEFIEFRLLWEGRVNRSDLINFFGISVPQASLDFAKYRELAPANAVYDGTQKTYLAGGDFSPVLVNPSADAYLNRIRAVEAGNLELGSTFIGWQLPVGIVTGPSRAMEAGTLRLILQAIRERKALRIEYQSMNAAAANLRAISPHALGFDGFRWHARAYCHQHDDFRDFVLARILRIDIDDASKADPAADVEWHQFVEAVVVPGDGLSASQKKVIELDYGMKNGRLVLRVREALLFYFLKHLGLLYGPDDVPAKDQIVLANRKELVPFFRKHGIGSDRAG
jgi:WYL domain